MDLQLDVRIKYVRHLRDIKAADYQEDYSEVCNQLKPHQANLMNEIMHYRVESKLWSGNKVVLPKKTRGINQVVSLSERKSSKGKNKVVC